MFDGQIYLDELFGDHDVAAEIPEKGSPPSQKSCLDSYDSPSFPVDARYFSYGKLFLLTLTLCVDSFWFNFFY